MLRLTAIRIPGLTGQLNEAGARLAAQFVTADKVVLPQTLFNVIEPPAYDTLESMISTIEQHMKGATS